MENRTLPKSVINLFFILGLFSATLFRIIIFLNRIDLSWARIAWYAGITGYVLFFGYRYYIARKRRKSIIENILLNKVRNSDIEITAKHEIEYLLNSLTKSREVLNYIYIFVTSILAVVVDLVLTFIQK